MTTFPKNDYVIREMHLEDGTDAVVLSTKDRFFAAILRLLHSDHAVGHSRNFQHPKLQVWHHFTDPNRAEEIIRDYKSGKLQVDPREFQRCLEEVTTIFGNYKKV
jgi:hypothetical protein